MENINIGIANLIIGDILKKKYTEKKFINESKGIALDFVELIKNSPILKTEFQVFNNIENKCILNEFLATKYINDNIKLFEIFTLNEITNERNKLKEFLKKLKISSIPNDNRIKLYESINNLIEESLINYELIIVDKGFESFTYVLNHIMNNNKTINENVEYDQINDVIVELSVKKFNEKYSTLDKNDITLIENIVKTDKADLNNLFESEKNKSLTLLKEVNYSSVNDNIQKAIQRVSEMSYDENTVIEDIIKLYELNKELM